MILDAELSFQSISAFTFFRNTNASLYGCGDKVESYGPRLLKSQKPKTTGAE